MFRIVFDTERLPNLIRVYQIHWNEIFLPVDAIEIAQRQWPIICRVLEGTPKVDYLITIFQEFGDFFGGKVAMDASGGCFESLVDVGALDRLAL